MNADRITRWLTLGANIGVVIGLFLVAIQRSHKLSQRMESGDDGQ